MEIPKAINDMQFAPETNPPAKRPTVEEVIEELWQEKEGAPPLVPFDRDRPGFIIRNHLDMELSLFGEDYVRKGAKIAVGWACEVASVIQKHEKDRMVHLTSSYRLKINARKGVLRLCLSVYKRPDNAP